MLFSLSFNFFFFITVWVIRWLHCEVLWWWLFARLWGCWENGWPFNPRLHFFFFKVEISPCTLIPLFRSGSSHNGSASWDNSGRVFPDELCVSSFPDRFPRYAWPSALYPFQLHWIKFLACLDVTCHLHFWQNDQGLLCATAVTRGWNGHWIRVSKQS